MIRVLVTLWITSACCGLGLPLALNAEENLNQYSAQEFHTGKIINLADLSGNLIYLDFWASWCAPCRQSFPFMESLNQQFQSKGLKIIAINIDENKQDAEDFLKQYPVSFLNLYDPNGQIGKPMKVKQMPTSFLIDQRGKVLFKHSGFDAEYASTAQAAITKLLDSQ